MKIFFATSNPPHITEKDTRIWRRIKRLKENTDNKERGCIRNEKEKNYRETKS